MTVAERRQALLEWFYADEERSGMRTTEIAKRATYHSGIRIVQPLEWIYAGDMTVTRHRASRDLKALERDGHITRGQTSGKATWWYA